MEFFSTELEETIAHKCSKDKCFENIGWTYALCDIY